MRTLRPSLAGTVIFALLGGLGGAVSGQDEPPDPMAPARVSGSVGEAEATGITLGDSTFDEGATITEGWQATISWDASDPRLDGEVAQAGSTMEYRAFNPLSVGATSRVLVNDDGRWVGTGTGLTVPGVDMEFVVMHGEGAYEGLTAVVWEDWSVDPPTFAGAIIPSDKMPAFPELPAE